MKVRHYAGVLALVFATGQVWAQGGTVVFAVSEGASYRVNPGATAERFREISEDLTKLLKRPVKVQPVTDDKELAVGLAEQRYDMAYGFPAHHSIRAMTRNGYNLVALSKGFTDYRASFPARGDSPLKTLADPGALRPGARHADAINPVIMRTALRDLPRPLSMETSQLMIASSKLSEAQRARLTIYFVSLEQSAHGKRRLGALDVPGFVGFDQSAGASIGKRLGI